MLKKLKDKWGISTPFQMIIVFIVFGVTGSVEVEGYIKASGSIQVGVNEGSPTAALVGSIRYKSDANNSFVDMVMQTDVTTYEWVNIVTNTW